MTFTFARKSGPTVSVAGGGTDDNRPGISAWGTTAEWDASGHILGPGELGWDTSTGLVKPGDGGTRFAGLPSVGSGIPVTRAIMPEGSVFATTAGPTAWFAANYSAGARFGLSSTVTFSRARIPCGTASGNIEVAIYSVSRTAAATFDLAKVTTTGVIACPTPTSSVIEVSFTTQVALPPGDYVVALWCDNTTATFCHVLSNTLLQAGWSLASINTPGGLPSAATGQGYSGRAVMLALEAVIPTRLPAVTLGDSITASQSWFSLANAQIGSKCTLSYNAGVPGQTTSQILARVSADVIARAPSIVTVLGGTNNIGAATTIDPAPIIADLTSIVSQILAGTTAKIALGTITPREHTSGVALSASQIAAVTAVNDWVKAQGTSRVSVVDWAPAMSVGGDGLTPDLSLFSDHVHPNDAGQVVMAGVLRPILAAMTA